MLTTLALLTGTLLVFRAAISLTAAVALIRSNRG